MGLGIDRLSELSPSVSLSGTVGMITWGLLIIILALAFGVFAFYIMQRKKFKYKIVIFEKVNGKFQPTRKDVAMESKVGRMGHVCFYLKKHRVFRVRPKLQTGIRTYWYFIREDGTWINFDAGDWDQDSRNLGAHMVDVDMRMADAELEGSLRERYDKPKLWAQYGTVIISIGFIVIVAVMAWFLFDKWIEIAQTINGGIATTGEILGKLDGILGKMDNVCMGGSGVISV